MADLEQLQITLGADATKAVGAIDTLINKLGQLTTSLNNINPSSLGMLAQNVDRLSSAMNGIKNIDSRSYQKLASNLRMLGNVDGIQLQNTANGMKSIANAMQVLQGTTYDGSTLRTIASSITTLGNSAATNAGANLPILSSRLQEFINSLNSIGSLTFQVDSLAQLIDSITRLGGKNATASMTNLPTISQQVVKFVNDLNQTQGFNFDVSNIATLVKAINDLGKVATGKAIQNIPQLAEKIKILFTTLSTCPSVSQDVTQLLQAMSGLNARVNMVQPQARVASSGLNTLSTAMRNTNKSAKSLAYMFGKFYANFFLIIRGIKALWGAIDSSMDFIETFNYFQASFEQVDKKAQKTMKEMGGNSADAYVEGFANESLKLTKKMTGYIVDANGQLQSSNEVSLGINPDTLLNYQAQFAQISSSIGVASDYAQKMSDALSMIGADLASVKNMQNADVWDNLSSAIVGQSKAVDKYGVNIREAALQEELANLGIDANIKKLSQQDKALLRTITILDSSRYAWADLSDTLSQPSNQIKMLKANVEALGRTIGGMFLGSLARVLPYINAFMIALRKLAEYIINLFGIKIPTITAASAGGMENLEDSIGCVGDAIDGASGSAKKLKQNLLGIDELNVISGNDDASGGGGGGFGGITSDLYNAFDDIFEEYQKVWQKAYEGVENEAENLANRIVNAIKQGKWYEIGRTISDFIADQLEKIKWDKIFESFKKFGSGLAQFLNGLINPRLFEDIGKTVANGMNTIIYMVESFARNFNWGNLGDSYAKLINGFFKDIDVKALAVTISKVIKGALKAVTHFLANTDFYLIGQRVGTFLAELDWAGILQSTAVAMVTALSGLFDGLGGVFDANPLAGIIITGILGVFTFTKIQPIATALLTAFTNVKTLGLFKGVGATLGLQVGQGMATQEALSGVTASATSFASHFATVFMGAFAGYKIGNFLAEQIYGEEWTVANNKEMMADYFDPDRVLPDTIKLNNAWQKEMSKIMEDMGHFKFSEENQSPFGKEFTAVTADIDSIIWGLDNLGVEIDDVSAVSEQLNTRYANLSEDSKNFVLTLSEQYDSLTDLSKVTLAHKYNIDLTTSSMNTEEKALLATKDAISQYAQEMGASIDEIANYNMYSEETRDLLESQHQALITQERAVNATKEAVKQYAEEQRKSMGIVQDSSDQYASFVDSLSMTSISADELSEYVNVLSNTDIPTMSTNLDDLVTNIQEKIPTVHETITTTIDDIRTKLEESKTWFDENIVPILDGEYWSKALEGVPKAFETAFTSACKGVVAIFNRMITAINKSFDLQWDDFEVDGETVIEGGTQKLLQIKKIEGFATGGYPNTGDLFYANEKGAELIGTMNGKTAVASNGEITGIRDAIYGVATEIINEMRNGNNVNVTLQGDARGMFNAVRNEARVYQRSTGQGAFNF